MTPIKGRTSGYSVLAVYSTYQELHGGREPTKEASEKGGMRFGWDWRWVEHGIFEVRISVVIEPSPERHEFIGTNAIGRFKQLDEPPNVKIEEFVRLQAVAILLPYARQFLSNLTLNSGRGVYYLPTINVNALMAEFESFKPTAETQQIPEDPTRAVGDNTKRKATRRSSKPTTRPRRTYIRERR